jgi:hypothetical protein
MHRRSVIASGLGAAVASALPGLALAQSTSEAVEQEQLPPPEPIDTSHPDAGEAAPAETAAAGAAPPPPAQDAAPADAGESPTPPNPRFQARPSYPANTRAQTYSRGEILNSVSSFFGVTTEAAAGIVEKVFKDQGEPTAYIAGEEGSAAFIGGLRYGKGLLYMKGREPMQVYWQGPSIGFDWGGNASRVFCLCYNLQYPDMIFRRFPGVDGSAYLIGGLGVNYQRADDITLAPIRTGLGLRLGASVGYLSYSRKKRLIPF